MSKPAKATDHPPSFERFEKLAKIFQPPAREELQKKLDKYEKSKRRKRR